MPPASSRFSCTAMTGWPSARPLSLKRPRSQTCRRVGGWEEECVNAAVACASCRQQTVWQPADV